MQHSLVHASHLSPPTPSTLPASPLSIHNHASPLSLQDAPSQGVWSAHGLPSALHILRSVNQA